MKSTRPLFAILILLTGFASLGKAQDQPLPTTNANSALAEQLVGLMHLDQAVGVGINGMKQMQSKMGDSLMTNASPEIKATMQKSMASSMNAVTSFMTPEKMHTMYVSVYSSIFTAEELQGAIDFFKSPVGQKWVEKQPQVSLAIMGQTMAMMPKMSQMMDTLNKSMGAAMTNPVTVPTSPTPSTPSSTVPTN